MVHPVYTLYQGDSVDILKTMHDDSVDAIISDPPYDLSVEAMDSYLAEFRRISRGVVILFMKPENPWPKADQYLFWTKPISTKNTSKRYSRFVEVIHVYGSDTAKWRPEGHWSNYVNIFVDRLEMKPLHQHQKPLSLMEALIRNHSDEGDTILDPFCGSGTTMLAAARTGRSCISFEIDSKNIPVATGRLESHGHKVFTDTILK